MSAGMERIDDGFIVIKCVRGVCDEVVMVVLDSLMMVDGYYITTCSTPFDTDDDGCVSAVTPPV